MAKIVPAKPGSKKSLKVLDATSSTRKSGAQASVKPATRKPRAVVGENTNAATRKTRAVVGENTNLSTRKTRGVK